MLVLGYGSLMNPESLAKTSPTATILKRVRLQGYQRKANAMSDAFPEVAMNIVPNEHSSLLGALINLPEVDLPALRQRETGYEMVDVTAAIEPRPEEAVFTFIAPDRTEYRGKKIHQSYLDVCLGGVPETEREQWLAETIIECEITTAPRQKEYRHS